MPESSSALYAAFKAKDARFDGRFFVGISSTGIYCRPICRAKQPKPENCTFYSTAAEAEQDGYRPCLLCRPELAPGSSTADNDSHLVYRAARMMEEDCGSGQSLVEIAGRLGCTDRHLRRVFAAEYNVSPIQYLQTCRLLLAKNLLTDTDLSVLEIAMASGFGSLRRFHDLFKQHYRLSPTDLRKRIAAEQRQSRDITLALVYRPPYHWEEMLRLLSGQTIAGIDIVANGEYLRTVYFVHHGGKPVCGWVRVGHKPQKRALAVTVSETLLPVLPQVLARVRHLFDLHCEPQAVYETLRSMNAFRPGLCVLGARVPGCFHAFEMAVRALLGRQATAKAAGTMAARIAQTYGIPVATGMPALTHAFPSPEDILALEGPIESHFGPLGVPAKLSAAIYELARSLTEGRISLDSPPQPEEEMKRLTAVRGIDSWTAQYIAMRAMQWTDAFCESDRDVEKALYPLTAKEIQHMAEAWRPWRSYAMVNLWNAR